MSDWINIARNAIPLAIGACASSVIGDFLKDALPEATNLGEKIVRKVGLFGISAVVSGIVAKQMQTEVDAVSEVFSKPEPVDVQPVELSSEEKEATDGGSAEA